MAEDIDADIELEPATASQDDTPDTDDEPEVKAEAEPEDADETEGEEEGDEESSEDAEVEYAEIEGPDGKKYQIPAALKDGYLRQQDYTKKTQTVAEERKALEAEREAIAAARASDQQYQVALGRLAALDEQLSGMFGRTQDGKPIGPDQVDWDAWTRRNPQQAQAALARVQALREQRRSLESAVESAKKQHESDANESIRKRVEATRDFAQQNVPNWSPDRDKAIAELIGTVGMEEGDALKVLSPAFYQLADLALDGHRYREAKRAKSSKPKAGSEKVVPLKKVAQRGGAPEKGLSDKLSTEEWVRRRNKVAKTG